MRDETLAGREARARPEDPTAENADDPIPTVDPLLVEHDLPCGASIPHEDGDDVEPLCVDGSTCEFPASYVVERDGDKLAVCGCHLPDSEPTTRERTAPDGGDDLPADPFDRSPEDYDVSDHPAAVGDSHDGGS